MVAQRFTLERPAVERQPPLPTDAACLRWEQGRWVRARQPLVAPEVTPPVAAAAAAAADQAQASPAIGQASGRGRLVAALLARWRRIASPDRARMSERAAANVAR